MNGVFPWHVQFDERRYALSNSAVPVRLSGEVSDVRGGVGICEGQRAEAKGEEERSDLHGG